ncbi:MAG: glutaredoxin domain-containing protein [Pseudohongiellaceae bacterium]
MKQETGNTNRGERLVHDWINDPGYPVTIFSRGFCSYCTAVKNLFRQIGVEFRAIEVDAPEYCDKVLYGEIRECLFLLTGQATLPQVFIGSEAVGGYTESYDLYFRRELQDKLEPLGYGFE